MKIEELNDTYALVNFRPVVTTATGASTAASPATITSSACRRSSQRGCASRTISTVSGFNAPASSRRTSTRCSFTSRSTYMRNPPGVGNLQRGNFQSAQAKDQGQPRPLRRPDRQLRLRGRGDAGGRHADPRAHPGTAPPRPHRRRCRARARPAAARSTSSPKACRRPSTASIPISSSRTSAAWSTTSSASSRAPSSSGPTLIEICYYAKSKKAFPQTRVANKTSRRPRRRVPALPEIAAGHRARADCADKGRGLG